MASAPKAAAPVSWDDGDPLLVAALSRLRTLPSFPRAVRTLAGNMLALYQSDRGVAGIFTDAGRYVAAMVAVSMRRDGATLARVKELAASFGLLSPGRAYALLTYLRYLGYVELWADRAGEGGAVYRLSQNFVDAWREHLVAALEAAALIDPVALDVARQLADPEWFDAFTDAQMRGLRESLPALADMPAIASIFLDRQAGSPLLWTLITASAGASEATGRVELSSSDLSARFGVSRMHISRILRDAERAELLLRPAPGFAEITALGREQIERLYAMQLARLLVSCERTLAAFEEAPSRR